jgi:hypothetical protein
MRLRLIVVAIALSVLPLFAQDSVIVPVILHVYPGTAAVNAVDFNVTLGDKKTSVTSLQSLANHPLHYVLVHDFSGSEKKNAKRGTLNSAPELLLKQIIKAGHDRGSLVNFSTTPYIDVEESDDPSKLIDKLEKTANGGSAIFDATVASADFLAKHPWQFASRDVIFLFTDGGDNASQMGLSGALTHLATMKIPVFIFISRFDDNGRSHSQMSQLAAATGGQIYDVSSPQATTLAINKAQQDLRNSFLLTIPIPAHSKGHFQLLSIKAPNMSVFAPAALDIKNSR